MLDFLDQFFLKKKIYFKKKGIALLSILITYNRPNGIFFNSFDKIIFYLLKFFK